MNDALHGFHPSPKWCVRQSIPYLRSLKNLNPDAVLRAENHPFPPHRTYEMAFAVADIKRMHWLAARVTYLLLLCTVAIPVHGLLTELGNAGVWQLGTVVAEYV